MSGHFVIIKLQLFIHFNKSVLQLIAKCTPPFLKTSSVPTNLCYVTVAKLTSFNVGTWKHLSCYYMLLCCNVSVEDNIKTDVKHIMGRRIRDW
jgi:hypothetical protein